MARPDSAKILQDCRDLLETDVGELIDELGPIIAEELVSRIEATRDEVKKANYVRLQIGRAHV